MPKTPQTSRTWCFTLNNPQDTQIPKTWPGVSYAVWQLEKGETPHLQGTVKFEKNKKLSGVKKIDDKAHWEPTLSEKGAINYCQKEETRLEGPWTIGSPPAPGKRSDLEAVQTQLDAGAALKDVYSANFAASCRYSKFFKEYKRVMTPKRNTKTICHVYFGPTKIGKSYACRTLYPDAYWLPQGKWFDDYDGEETVIIDEFYGWLPYSHLLRILDETPLSVETKGGHVQFNAKLVIITSNDDPREWYDRLKCKFAPLARRIEKCFNKQTLEADWDEVDLTQPPTR